MNDYRDSWWFVNRNKTIGNTNNTPTKNDSHANYGETGNKIDYA